MTQLYRIARAFALLVLVLVLGIFVVAPASLVMQRGPRLGETVTTQLSTNISNRERIVEPVVALAPSVDASIGPDSAGRAMYEIMTMLSTPRPNARPYMPEREGAPAIPLPSLFAEDSPFREIKSPSASLPDATKLIPQAVRGVSAVERAWLQELAEHPVWTPYAVLARATAADAIGARYVQPFPDGLDPFAMPFPQLSIFRNLAMASGSRAAWHLARGERERAEEVLREPIGVGRALLQSPWAIERLIGIVTIQMAQENLVAYDAAVGNPRGTALRAETDSLRAALGGNVRESESEGEARDASLDVRIERLLAQIRDPAGDFSSRFERLMGLGMLQCASVQRVVFGPRDDVTAAFAWGRESLARYESEREILRIAEAFPASLAGRPAYPLGRLPPRARLLETLGRVTGNARMQGCAFALAGTPAR